MNTQTAPVGAIATIHFVGDAEPVEGYYIHFGDCPVDDETYDDHIFYYAQDEYEIKQMMNVKNPMDFSVMSYELKYEVTA